MALPDTSWSDESGSSASWSDETGSPANWAGEQLPGGHRFLVDADGNYIVDGDGNYLSAGRTTSTSWTDE
jgi:hypothetical protein